MVLISHQTKNLNHFVTFKRFFRDKLYTVNEGVSACVNKRPSLKQEVPP